MFPTMSVKINSCQILYNVPKIDTFKMSVKRPNSLRSCFRQFNRDILIQVQFGHANACANSTMETAVAKNEVGLSNSDVNLINHCLCKISYSWLLSKRVNLKNMIILSDENLSDKILVTSPKIRQFCPTNIFVRRIFVEIF